jgi:hypothetical protein
MQIYCFAIEQVQESSIMLICGHDFSIPQYHFLLLPAERHSSSSTRANITLECISFDRLSVETARMEIWNR